MKVRKAAAASLGLAILGIVLGSAVNGFVFRSIDELGRLESRRNCEIIMNELFASLRDHDDFGSAIEASATLKADILGLGLYDRQGSQVYAWGRVPASYADPVQASQEHRSAVRSYLENARNSSFVLILWPFGLVPPPPHGPPPREDGKIEDRGPPKGPPPADRPFLFTTLKRAEVVYLEIRQPSYWASRKLRAVLFPLAELLIILFVLFVRGLLLRNSDYRRRIEEQRNLVILGTAASTLAHEIKNPLLSIRLQSSILEKTCPEDSRRELEIINGEVDRLSALSYRVNDWLREPLGKPGLVELPGFLREICVRLLGADRLALGGGAPGLVSIDPDRLRSALENLLRNALESGDPGEGILVELGGDEGQVFIDILDRGRGIPKEDRDRVFDPFFTTKSRGSGIGLAISRRFVEAAGGSIGIEDRQGGGTRVRVSLPRARQEIH